MAEIVFPDMITITEVDLKHAAYAFSLVSQGTSFSESVVHKRKETTVLGF